MRKLIVALVTGLLCGITARAASSDQATAQVQLTVVSYVSIVCQDETDPSYVIVVTRPGKSESDGHNVIVSSNSTGWVRAGVVMDPHPDAPTLDVTPEMNGFGGLPVKSYQPGTTLPIAVTVTAITTIADKPGVYSGTLTVTAVNDV